MDSSDFLIDCPFKFEGIEGFKEFSKSLFGFFFDVRGCEYSLVGGCGFIVKFDDFRSHALFFDKLDGGDEKVVLEAPLVFVGIV